MEYTKTTVKEIGYLQRKILHLLAVTVLASIIICRYLHPSLLTSEILFLIVAIMNIILLWKLLTQMGKGIVVKLISSLLLLLPLINYIPLLIFSILATGILKRNGIKVGFLGASPKDLEQLTSEEEIQSI